MRHLGGAVQFENVARGVVAADGAAGLQRHAGVPADGELEFDDVLGGAEHRIDVAIALADDRRLGAVARRKFHRRRLRVEQRRQFLDLHRDEIGGVLGDVRVFGEHRGDRLADIAHRAVRQHRLAIRIERRDGAFAKIDRRHVGDVGGGPHRDDAGQRPRRGRIDRDDAAVGVRRAHDAHVQLMREIDVAGELAAAGDQRRVFQPRDRLADPRHFCFFHAHRESRVFPSVARRAWRGHAVNDVSPVCSSLSPAVSSVTRAFRFEFRPPTIWSPPSSSLPATPIQLKIATDRRATKN